MIEDQAEKFFEPEELKVFKELPSDQRNTEIHETFVPAAQPSLPKNEDDWKMLRDGWRTALREKSFAAWPAEDRPLDAKQVFSAEYQGVALRAIDFTSQNTIRLRLYIAHRSGLERPELVVLNSLDDNSWNEFLATMRPAFEDELKGETLTNTDERSFKQYQSMFRSFKWAMAYIATRGIGATAWDQSERKQTQHRRRFYLLGQTLDGMRVFDVRRAIRTLRTAGGMKDVPLQLQSHGRMAGVTLYASLFEPGITRLDLYALPRSHRDGPFLLNVRRFLDMPQAVAMASEKSRVVIYQLDDTGWDYPTRIAKQFEWKNSVQLRKPRSGD